MENAKYCGSTFLGNLKSRRLEVEKSKSENKSESIEKIYNINQLNERENLIVNLEEVYPIDEFYEEQLELQLEEIANENSFNNETLTNNRENIIKTENSEIDKLKYELELQKRRIEEKEIEIDYLKAENSDQKVIISDFHQTLMREQEIVMKEQDLHEKTLSRAEKLLLDKREELIERQNYKKRNWFLKLFDRNRM